MTMAMTSTPKRVVRGAPRLPFEPFPPILPMPKNSNSNTSRNYLDITGNRDEAFWANRTVLYIDVPHAVHKQIIGPQGNNQKQISKETGCHIHLPDANKNPNLAKVNKVQISGLTENVEPARQRIRNMEPLFVTFELCNLRDGAVPNQSTVVKEIHYDKVGYTILRNDPQMQMRPSCTVRGQVGEVGSIISACKALTERLMNPETIVTYCVSVEIDPKEVYFVVGGDGTPIKAVADKTGVQIGVPLPGSSTFNLRGPSVEKVLLARNHLLGLMPVQFNFARPFDFSVTNCSEMAKTLDLSISIINNLQGFSKGITIRSHEFRLSDVYAARHRILQLPGTAPLCRDYEFMADMKTWMTMVPSSNPASPLFGRGSITSSSSASGSLSVTSPPLSSSSTGSGTVFTFDQPSSQNGLVSDLQLQTAWMRGTAVGTTGIKIAECPLAPPPSPMEKLNSPRHRQVSFACKGGSHANLTDSSSCDLIEMDRSVSVLSITEKENADIGLNRSVAKLEARQAMDSPPVNKKPRIPNNKFSGLYFSQSLTMTGVRFNDSVDSQESTEEESRCTIDSPASNSFSQSHSTMALKGILKNTSDFAVSNIETGRTCHSEWDPREFDEPRKVLEKLNMHHLQEKFDEEGIDMEAFILLNETDFKEIFNVTTLGARRKLMNAVTCLKHNRSYVE